MPAPQSSLATQRPDLAESLMEFDLQADQQGYIGPRVLPAVDVMQQSGNFGKIPLEELLQNADTKRAPGSHYNSGEWTFQSDTYATEEHGFEEPVDDREAQMYANYFDAEVISTMRARNMVLRSQEERIASLIFSTSNFNNTSVSNEWDENHISDATPIEDVKAAQFRAYDASGLWPNAIVMNAKVFKNLRLLDAIKNAITSNGAGDSELQGRITRQQIAQAFDLDFVLVAGGSKNSANEGQSPDVAQIWSSEYAWVGRIATTQDFREPCAGRIFHWSQDGSSRGGTVETYRDERRRADIVRVRHDVDEKLLYTECGELLENVTTI